MDAILVASGALAILREAMQAIDAGVANSTIPVEKQEALMRKIDAIRNGDFDGPEWKVEPY